MAGHQFFKERCVEDFTILVFFTSAVLHDVVGFLLSRTLTQRHEDMVQLSTDHEAVFSFVVQLHALHEILVGSHILVFFAVTEDGQELIQFELLVSLLLGATHLLDESVGWVQFESLRGHPSRRHPWYRYHRSRRCQRRIFPFPYRGRDPWCCWWGRSCTLKIQKRHSPC